MAEIIPELNPQTLSRMTSGERRVAHRLKELLEDDYLVWYDIPVGRLRRYPDFIILHPARGLLFLEVKDWKPESIKKVNKSDVTLLTGNGLKICPHPLEQVRQYAYTVINTLVSDPQLRQSAGKYAGNLLMPYGWGVVFTNVARRQIESAVPLEKREGLFPDHLILYKDEITASTDPEQFQEHLWGMFNYRFGGTLTLPQINRIRWHLFPEVRIDGPATIDLFDTPQGQAIEKPASDRPSNLIPDIIKIMDVQQEQLARSLGDGHRVIHGVAGSGKTLILGYRCIKLAQTMRKPILVLCFNITLAARLRAFISSRGIGNEVEIYHFHDWCNQQIKTYHVELIRSARPVWERQVETVIRAVDKEQIPRGQYGALLIDEGHDFEAEWLTLVAQMVDPETNSLLLLYDDAQSIYKKKSGLGFSLSSVGIQAQGRTTILRMNYRNSREILHYAYNFARHYLNPQDADDDHIPLIEPEAAGTTGATPVLKALSSPDQEVLYAAKCIVRWRNDGVALKDMGVLFTAGWWGPLLSQALAAEGIDHQLLGGKQAKARYNPITESVTLLTVHSSKGLEFARVIMIGTGHLGQKEERISEDARLLYVGMTRAQDCLLLTSSKESRFSELLSTS